jgi:hypothetical protein
MYMDGWDLLLGDGQVFRRGAKGRWMIPLVHIMVFGQSVTGLSYFAGRPDLMYV